MRADYLNIIITNSHGSYFWDNKISGTMRLAFGVWSRAYLLTTAPKVYRGNGRKEGRRWKREAYYELVFLTFRWANDSYIFIIEFSSYYLTDIIAIATWPDSGYLRRWKPKNKQRVTQREQKYVS